MKWQAYESPKPARGGAKRKQHLLTGDTDDAGRAWTVCGVLLQPERFITSRTNRTCMHCGAYARRENIPGPNDGPQPTQENSRP